MPSTAEPPRDPGLAAERTALAWQRMALGFTSMAAVNLAAAAHRQAPWLTAPAGSRPRPPPPRAPGLARPAGRVVRARGGVGAPPPPADRRPRAADRPP